MWCGYNPLGRRRRSWLLANEWQRQITDPSGTVMTSGQDVVEGQFGVVASDLDQPIPAPALPDTLKLFLGLEVAASRSYVAAADCRWTAATVDGPQGLAASLDATSTAVQ